MRVVVAGDRREGRHGIEGREIVVLRGGLRGGGRRAGSRVRVLRPLGGRAVVVTRGGGGCWG